MGAGCRREQPAGPFMVALTPERGRPRAPAAGRQSRAEGHWFANAPELKGAGVGLWGGIVIRGQIAPLPALLESGGGVAGSARARRAPSPGADVLQLEACAPWGALSLVPGGGGGRHSVGRAQSP